MDAVIGCAGKRRKDDLWANAGAVNVSGGDHVSATGEEFDGAVAGSWSERRESDIDGAGSCGAIGLGFA